MDGLYEIIDRLIKDRNLDEKSFCYEKAEKENFYYLEGINQENSYEERYLIYNCSDKNQTFNFSDYMEMMSKDISLIPVIIFETWENEMEQFYKCSKDLKGSEQKELKNVFSKKTAMYSEMKKSLKLEVLEQENYNEYIIKDNQGNDLEGFIYNLSLYDLKKLYNVTGDALFKKNVRKGITGGIGNKIKNKFRNYLYVYLFSYLEKLNITEDQRVSLMSELDLDENIISECSPNIFWFCHNGITIFSYGEKIDRTGSYIKLNPMNVSVINGAQTLTNFYYELERLKRETYDKISTILDFIKQDIIELKLDEASKKTIVKTIFIDGKEEYVKTITSALNSQIPIADEHILADSEDVYQINLILRKAGMEILKEGYVKDEGFGVIEFIKKYLIIEKKPGKSKNLQKRDLKKYLNEALEKISIKEKYYLDRLKMLVDLDSWWNTSKKERNNIYYENNEKILNNYGKNYFGSYIIVKAENNEELLDGVKQTFEVQYKNFVDDFISLDIALQLSEFKKDTMFELYVETKAKEQQGEDYTIFGKTENKDLIKYLSENVKERKMLNKTIQDFFQQRGNKLEYFRIVSRKNQKSKESYPFPTSSFSEIYLKINEGNAPLKFKESRFYSEIKRKFLLFVIEEANDEDYKIEDVKLIENFTFEDYIIEAEKVYNKVLEAFEFGDIELFPKVSSNMKFHIRPKAINSEDTFEFSNGEEITKRTFWANKATVDELIDKNR